jgi:hypothetical protein
MSRRCTIFLIFICTLPLSFSLEPALRGQSPAPAQQENTEPARFSYSGNAAQVPATFISNLIFLPVSINRGKPSLFELDSAASATSVDPSRVLDAAVSRCP